MKRVELRVAATMQVVKTTSLRTRSCQRETAMKETVLIKEKNVEEEAGLTSVTISSSVAMVTVATEKEATQEKVSSHMAMETVTKDGSEATKCTHNRISLWVEILRWTFPLTDRSLISLEISTVTSQAKTINLISETISLHNNSGSARVKVTLNLVNTLLSKMPRAKTHRLQGTAALHRVVSRLQVLRSLMITKAPEATW